MAARGRGRGRYSWSRGLQQSTQANRTWHRAAGHPSVSGAGGGQSWDPFRPVRDLQPTPASSEVLPASGSSAAYTRTSLSKLVLQNRASDVNSFKAHDERKEGVSQHRGQPAPRAKSAFPLQPPATEAVHISGATQGQTTQQAAAERRAHTAGQGAAAAAHPQPRLSKSGTAEAAVRHTRRTWQRQSEAVPGPAAESMLQASKGRGQTENSTVFAAYRHASTWQRKPQTPRFARRGGNQLVRLSSASPGYSSVLLRSGSRRAALKSPIARSIRATFSAHTHVATTPRASSLARPSSSAGASPSVLVRRGNKLVRVARRGPPVQTQVYKKLPALRRPSAQGVPPAAKLHRAQNQLQRPTQLRRIGSVMYRVGKSANGSHSLQRTETPRRILKPAAALTPISGMPPRPQTPKYIRRAGKLVRMATPNAALLKPAAAALASGAKAAAALRLLKQAQMRRHCSRVYNRQPKAQGNPASPRQPALCPAFCRTGRCEGQRKGQCRLRHDPAWVTVCSRWLHGSCTDVACPLQHAASPDVMPLCMFHLKGLCSKDSCIYLHKELPASSGVCRAYAAGFCPKGKACTQKHLTPKMLRELRASRTLRAGNAKVATSKSQASSSGQGPSKAVKAALEHEDGGKKRKWRYFWAEEEEAS